MARSNAERLQDAVRAIALEYPETHEDHPWGDVALKVRKKAFVFMGTSEDGSTGFSVKLPYSVEEALQFPNTEPTGYGLGKSGWVSFRYGPRDKVPPRDELMEWIDESYRAIAPKTLVKQLPDLDA